MEDFFFVKWKMLKSVAEVLLKKEKKQYNRKTQNTCSNLQVS